MSDASPLPPPSLVLFGPPYYLSLTTDRWRDLDAVEEAAMSLGEIVNDSWRHLHGVAHKQSGRARFVVCFPLIGRLFVNSSEICWFHCLMDGLILLPTEELFEMLLRSSIVDSALTVLMSMGGLPFH